MTRPPLGRPHGALALLFLANLAVLAAWPLLSGSAVRSAAAPMYAALCHQQPERCYHVGGEPLPVCARCLGLWLGLFLAAALAALAWLPAGAWRRTVACALLGWLVLSWLVGRWLPAGWHLERTVAGLAGGAGMYLLAWPLGRRLARWLRPSSR